jgi:CrcB protein
VLKLILIGLGGGVGAVLRYLISGWGQTFSDGTFPLGTIGVNILGCGLIGFLGAAWAGPFAVREEYRLALMVGVLGGFTTFSSFGLETFSLLREGQRAAAIANVLASNLFGLLAVWVGFRLAARLFVKGA